MSRTLAGLTIHFSSIPDDLRFSYSLNLFSDGGANGGESLELNTGDSILSQKYGRVRSSNGGLVDLHWSSVVHPDDRERTFFKLTKEFLDFDTLDRSIGWDAHERMYESDPSIAYRTLKYPLPCPDEYSLPTLGVIAETLVISICAHRENDGIYTSASASLVYAEFKTIDEWTKTCLAPAVAVSATSRSRLPRSPSLTCTSRGFICWLQAFRK